MVKTYKNICTNNNVGSTKCKNKTESNRRLSVTFEGRWAETWKDTSTWNGEKTNAWCFSYCQQTMKIRLSRDLGTFLYYTWKVASQQEQANASLPYSDSRSGSKWAHTLPLFNMICSLFKKIMKLLGLIHKYNAAPLPCPDHDTLR
jgi:hypothetical protein